MNRLNLVRLLVVICLTATSSVSLAKEPPGSGPNPYRDCGIGAALFPNTNWAAVTSNVIWDLGTTAVTSATSSPETCSVKNIETAQFIIDNYDNLAEETARGQGEYLSALLSLRGCSMDYQGAAVSTLRTNLAEQVKAQDYGVLDSVTKASNYYDVTLVAAADCAS